MLCTIHRYKYRLCSVFNTSKNFLNLSQILEEHNNHYVFSAFTKHFPRNNIDLVSLYIFTPR